MTIWFLTSLLNNKNTDLQLTKNIFRKTTPPPPQMFLTVHNKRVTCRHRRFRIAAAYLHFDPVLQFCFVLWICGIQLFPPELVSNVSQGSGKHHAPPGLMTKSMFDWLFCVFHCISILQSQTKYPSTRGWPVHARLYKKNQKITLYYIQSHIKHQFTKSYQVHVALNPKTLKSYFFNISNVYIKKLYHHFISNNFLYACTCTMNF